MDVIEFLQKTDQRNLKFNIDFLVKEKMRENNRELQCRRERLRDMLEAEGMQYNEELLQLMNDRLKASEQKRLDWIGLMRLERQQAVDELLKLKNMQRELENCEGWRHLETHKILIDAKKCQLFQIGEKRVRKRKDDEIDRMWQLAMERLQAEKERHDVYEQKLQKVIADSNQARNEKQDQDMQALRDDEQKMLRAEYAQGDARAVAISQVYSQAALQRERHKNLQHTRHIQQQIKQHQCDLERGKALALHEETYNRMQEDAKIIRQLNDKIGQRIQNREWHKSYLSHISKEREQQRNAAKELDDAYLGTGCVLQQQRKSPYGKYVR